MSQTCTLQLHVNGAWHDAGAVSLLGDEKAGWQARSYTAYSADWALQHARQTDARAFSSSFAVDLKELELNHWPVFLIDVLPQGYGRAELLRRLGISALAQESADWRLLLAGAGNPVGNLRVKEAAEWLSAQEGEVRGFTDEEVSTRAAHFAENLAGHGLFVAGSSGVQGEWPKLLLTRAEDGLLYLDHTLPDSRAREHYIVKFARGANPRLASILRHEAPYMQLARALGLRVHADLILKDRALFIPRFDRQVLPEGVMRLGQESVASFTGNPGFDSLPCHEHVCKMLLLRCSEPAVELLEYLKRDIANLALLNKDNHARNTALQRDFNGGVRLTPLFDFVPMYLHPDGIARRIRWRVGDGVDLSLLRIVDALICLVEDLLQDKSLKLSAKRRRELERVTRSFLADGLQAMLPGLDNIRDRGEDLGIEPDVHKFLQGPLREQMSQIEGLA